MNTETPTQIGAEIEREFQLFNVDILHENYSCTIDWGREMSKPHRSMLERNGFDVTEEKEGIYTLELDR